MLPLGLGMMCTFPLMGRLTDRCGFHWRYREKHCRLNARK